MCYRIRAIEWRFTEDYSQFSVFRIRIHNIKSMNRRAPLQDTIEYQ